MTKLLERGEPLYGTTHMSEFNQKASSWITKYAALKFCKYKKYTLYLKGFFSCLYINFLKNSYVAAIPWFNFTNHRSHGVDPKKYENDK